MPGGKPRRGNKQVEQGQALVELAAVLTILAILLFGIIEVVGLFSSRGNLSDASRAGVRLAVLNYDDTAILNSVLNVLNQHHMNTLTNNNCDVQKVEIYKVDPATGVMQSGPNSENIYPLANVGGTCTANPTNLGTYIGWPAANRLIVQAPGVAPPDIGVRITYNYHFRTPLLAAVGSNFTLTYESVLALGEDNANNYLNLASSTPVPTFTVSATPSSTPTNTPTTAPTGTASATLTPTPSATFDTTGCPAKCKFPTWTPAPTSSSTPIPPATGTPTQTFTPVPTPIPAPQGVGFKYFCDSSGHQVVGPGIKITWLPVPGATSYSIYYYVPPSKTAPNYPFTWLPPQPAPATNPNSGTLVATVTGTIYPPSVPPYYDINVTAGGEWVVVANLPGGGTSPPGYTQQIATSQVCAVNS